ncbi:MAG: transaldolase [Polyangiaceae bacterium]|nr:transaldolase [Polyangiaceae bacterium]
MSLLTELKRTTRVVADTGDIQSIEQFKPQDATTNPSLIAAAAQMPAYAEIVDHALTAARQDFGAGASPHDIVAQAIDELSVEFGKRILAIVPGRVSTEVDARLSFDEQGSIAKARKLIRMYEEAGVSKERILIKVASTWEGIRAAEKLEQEGIHCNLTLLFGLHQAIACAEAKVTLISPFVGRILDFYLKKTGKTSYPPAEDPGVVSVAGIYEYFKHFGYKTEVMGASFRNTGEILELAGCDLLTISPKLLDELASKDGEVPRKLDPEAAKKADVKRIAMNEPTFRSMHAADEMASFKLQEGIDGFTKSLVQLEKQLEERLKSV